MTTQLLVGQVHPKAKFRVVFKERVCPGRSIAFWIGRVRCCREATPINRGATGRVGDCHMISIQLRRQFNIGCFSTSGTRTTEFKQWLSELGVFDVGKLVDQLILIADFIEEVGGLVVLTLVHHFFNRSHFQRF